MGVTWIDSYRFGAAVESYSDIVLTDSPLGFWMLDDDALVGPETEPDLTANNHDLSYNNTPTVNQSGPSLAIPRAVLFDSAQSENMESANTHDYDIAASASWAVEMWLKYSTVGTTIQTPFSWRLNGSVSNPTTTAILTVNNGASGRIQLLTPNTSTGLVTLNSDGGWNDGNWHHVVARATSGGDADLWIDGVERATSATARNTSSDGATSGRVVALACNFTPSRAQFFAGYLAAVAIYNSALSDARIVAHYEAGA